MNPENIIDNGALSAEVPHLSRVACPRCGRLGVLELEQRQARMAWGIWALSGWSVSGSVNGSPVVRAPQMPVMALVCLGLECDFVAEPVCLVFR